MSNRDLPACLMVPLVYSPAYNITALGIERLHPFDSVKYARIHRALIRQGVRRAGDFVVPPPLAHGQLLSVHTADYLASLRQREVLHRILEIAPVRFLPAWLTDWRVLQPMRLATGGTAAAARLALRHGLAINLGGGYHHACPDRGGGFCVYADIPLALRLLHDEGLIHTALVVDVDAHQGDGIAVALRSWPWAHVLDFYETAIFPWPKQDEDWPVPLPARLRWLDYARLLREHLPAALEHYQPDIVLCNAGSDVLASDPLTTLRFSPDELVERDLYIADQVRRRGIPMVVTLSGGYGPESAQAHALSIGALVQRYETTPLPPAAPARPRVVE